MPQGRGNNPLGYSYAHSRCHHDPMINCQDMAITSHILGKEAPVVGIPHRPWSKTIGTAHRLP